jgi:hypothetical protein
MSMPSDASIPISRILAGFFKEHLEYWQSASFVRKLMLPHLQTRLMTGMKAIPKSALAAVDIPTPVCPLPVTIPSRQPPSVFVY